MNTMATHDLRPLQPLTNLQQKNGTAPPSISFPDFFPTNHHHHLHPLFPPFPRISTALLPLFKISISVKLQTAIEDQLHLFHGFPSGNPAMAAITPPPFRSCSRRRATIELPRVSQHLLASSAHLPQHLKSPPKPRVLFEEVQTVTRRRLKKHGHSVTSTRHHLKALKATFAPPSLSSTSSGP